MDRDRVNVPCLFYATFNNKILVYYNIQMTQIGVSNLLNSVQQLVASSSSSELTKSQIEQGLILLATLDDILQEH